MFLSARDLLLDNPATSGIALNKEQSARQHLVNEAVSASKLLISSFDAIRPFDALGNVELAGVQIEEARAHALQKINNLLEAIERTNSRVRNQANAELSVDDKPAAGPTAPAFLPATIRVEPAGKVERIELTSILPTPADLAATFAKGQEAMRWQA